MSLDIIFNIEKKLLIDKFNKKWAGKEIYFCPSIFSEINFTYSMVRLCCMCTLEPYTPPIVYVGRYHDYSKFDFTEYLTQIDRIMTLNQTDKAVCQGCDFFKKQIVPKFKFKGNIERFSFNHFTKCNANCVYCSCTDKKHDVAFPILPIIQKFEKYNMFSRNCIFNWAGGEPIICSDFNPCCSYLYKNKYKQTINSSGIEYNEFVEKCLGNGTANLIISPDSGTRETYLKIKRVDCFDVVWDNIKKYSKFADKMTIKYVFFSMNANEKDVYGFIDKCVWAGVKNIAITVENNSSHGNGLHFGQITDNEINMAILMKKLAIKHSINYSVWHMWKEDNKKKIEQG